MEYDPSDEEHQAIMQYLIEEGAAEISGMDEDGELIYKYDMEVLEEVLPELYHAMMDDIEGIMLDLFDKGLVTVSYDEELNAEMEISPEGRVALMEAGFEIPFDEDGK
jgi:hypothetical protein